MCIAVEVYCCRLVVRLVWGHYHKLVLVPENEFIKNHKICQLLVVLFYIFLNDGSKVYYFDRLHFYILVLEHPDTILVERFDSSGLVVGPVLVDSFVLELVGTFVLEPIK